MTILSIKQPENQTFENYYGDNAKWESLINKIKQLQEKGPIEVPIIINGKEIKTNNTFNSINPSNLSTVAVGHKGSEVEMKAAIDAALKAKKDWAALKPETRILLMKDLEKILLQRHEDIVAAGMLECGYNAVEAEGGYAEMIDFMRFNPFFYHQLLQQQLKDSPGETNSIVHRPLKGFTTAITPFNFPIAIGYNLPTVMAMTGNVVVWKPSSDAILVSYLFMQCLKDAGFPDGVINMIPCPGTEFGNVVLKHPELSAVNFTGSYDTAWAIKQIVEGSGKRLHFPRVIAETGGKDFMWVDVSAEPWLDDVADQIVAGAYGRSGQKCSANSRAYVHKSLLPTLLELLKQRLDNFTTGDPTTNKVNMGPVINEKAFNKITSYIEEAKQDPGCAIVSGGTFDKSSGYYIKPTVITVTDKRHKLMQEEIFGPVITIYGFDDEDEADTLKALDENGYKLTGSAYIKNPTKLEKYLPLFINNAGNLYINRKTTAADVARQPFGGDGKSGTNKKAGSKEYLFEFISPCVMGYRHTPRPTRG
jgi:1-pyrroline-5-carboxylate dehydrogenase